MSSWTIANLPADVIRKIVRFGQESVESIRLISHRWNGLATEHFTTRKHLPPIHCLRATFSNFQWPYTIFMSIPQGFQDYFGVDEWDIETRKSIYEDYEYVENSINCSRDYHPRAAISWGRNFDRIFGRCSSIGRLELRMTKETEKAIRSINADSLRELTIHEFALSGLLEETNELISLRNAVYNLLRTRSFRTLIVTHENNFPLSLKKFLSKRDCPFFKQCLRHVSAIQMHAVGSDFQKQNVMAIWENIVVDLNGTAGLRGELKITDKSPYYVHYRIIITASP